MNGKEDGHCRRWHIDFSGLSDVGFSLENNLLRDILTLVKKMKTSNMEEFIRGVHVRR